MEISPALAADLALLSDALDEAGGAALGAAVKRLVQDARLAVPSLLGFTLTLLIDGTPVSFTALLESADPGAAVTSAQLPLAALSEAEPGGTIVFYATRAGAFVDLVADVTFALGLHPDEIVLDADLHLAAPRTGVPLAGLADRSQVNQALGILIEQGSSPQQAGQELWRRAAEQNTSFQGAAIHLIEMTTQRFGRRSC